MSFYLKKESMKNENFYVGNRSENRNEIIQTSLLELKKNSQTLQR